MAPTLPASRGSLPPEGAAPPVARQSRFHGSCLHGRCVLRLCHFFVRHCEPTAAICGSAFSVAPFAPCEGADPPGHQKKPVLQFLLAWEGCALTPSSKPPSLRAKRGNPWLRIQTAAFTAGVPA